MRSKLPVDVHPVADIFPMMNEEEFAGLKEDIEKNGVRDCLTMWQGKLIDGRNRLAACLDLGIDWEGYLEELDDDADPVAFVLSHNLHRRHLSTSQRAMVAARVLDVYEERAKERQKRKAKSVVENLPQQNGSKARDEAGAALNVSGKMVDAAATVLECGSKDLIAKVESGEVAVSKAAKIAKEVPKAQQVKEAEKPRAKPERIIEKADHPKPEPPTRNVFGDLRRVFDSMNDLERSQAYGMWEMWIADTAASS